MPLLEQGVPAKSLKKHYRGTYARWTKKKAKEKEERPEKMISISILSAMMILSLRLCDDDMTAGLVFSGSFLFHEVFLSGLSGYWYSLTDALICLFIVITISKLSSSNYIKNLMCLCLGICLVVLVGWPLWVLSFPMGFLNGISLVLLIFAAVVTFRGKSDGELTSCYRRQSFFNLHNIKDCCHYSPVSVEVES